MSAPTPTNPKGAGRRRVRTPDSPAALAALALHNALLALEEVTNRWEKDTSVEVVWPSSDLLRPVRRIA